MGQTISRYVPIVKWLPAYSRRWLRADFVAGLTVVTMLLPEGVAYAELAGVPPEAAFLVAFAALIGFIRYNWYPAKILPGDSLTYLLGSLVAAGVIVGNLERSGILVMLVFAIEFLLKLRVKFKASCLGKLRDDGKLDPPYKRKIYSWTHFLMNAMPMTEKQVTVSLILIQLCFTAVIFLPI